MIKKVSKSGPPLTPEALNSDRNGMNSALPVDYANWLLKHNGGVPSPNKFMAKLYSDPEAIEVEYFLPFHPTGNIGHMDYVQGFRKHLIDELKMPLNFVPIAKERNGNAVYLLDMSVERGPVSVWYINAPEYEYDVNDESVHTIFDSFSDFIEAIGKK